MSAAAATGTIEVRSLKKAFGSQLVLDDVTFTIPGGETTVVLGPSGTGKSVLLKLIVGLIQPDEGSIHLDGRDLTKMTANK